MKTRSKKKKRWYEYLWLASLLYLLLGFFNILFAWLGLACFVIPLLIAVFRGNKAYCNTYCGRSQLFEILGDTLKLSRRKNLPAFFRTKAFRYGFLAFFMTMFGVMLYATFQVLAGSPLREVVTLLWIFKLPWQWADTTFVPAAAAQFAFGFYGVMLTSTLLGLLMMFVYRPRSWCVYCPMGTMTQGICKIKSLKGEHHGGESENHCGAA
ncbi:MAG: 4Fe-4S binding protein [Lachnospiraceae bacterium]